MKMSLSALALIALPTLALPTAAAAQAYGCTAPSGVLQIHPDLPSESQPVRRLPIGGYTLAITWAPQYCREHGDDPSARFQCGGGTSSKGARFGFSLHGLWPDGFGKDWPQYCSATGILPQPLVRRTMCSTPSAQLIQHEWAKHGTCMAGMKPAAFFGRSTGLYARLRYPDMDALSRAPLNAGRLAEAMAAANPGLGADMMRITATKSGWLDEIWICLDRRFAYARCPVHQGGLAPSAPISIWRGRR